MSHIARFLVKFHVALLVVVVALAAGAACLIPFVTVNKDMTRYIPSYMQSKIGLDLMTEEFGDSSLFRVVFEDVPVSKQQELADELKNVPDVTDVLYEHDGAAAADYHEGSLTLYKVTVDGGTYSEEASQAHLDLQEFAESTGYTFYLDSAVIDAKMDNLGSIIAFALVILLVILFIMSKSWFEPLLLLLTLGVAVALNMGTNVIFDSVSDTTFSIAAVFQLVLSLDYSVMLMNRYRNEREKTNDVKLAMENALKNAFGSITSSSLTTIVGLACLVLMSFTIGRDMGLVLAKGVLFSLLCVFTVMPSLVMWSDRIIQKTAKRALHPSMRGMAKVSYVARFPILAIFLLIFCSGFALRNVAEASFVLPSLNPDHEVVEAAFPSGSQIVVLYDADEVEKMADVEDALAKTEGIDSVSGYASTLGKKYTAAELADEMDMDATFARLLYYFKSYDGSYRSMTLNQFANYILNDVSSNSDFTSRMEGYDTSSLGSLITLTTPDVVTQERNAADMASFLASLGSNSSVSIDEDSVQKIYLLFLMTSGNAAAYATEEMSLPDFIDFVRNDVLSNEMFAALVSQDQVAQLDQLATYTDTQAMTAQLPAAQLAAASGMDETMIAQILAMAQKETMSIQEFFTFVTTNEQISAMLQPAQLAQLKQVLQIIDVSIAGTGFTPAEMSELFASLASAQASAASNTSSADGTSGANGAAAGGTSDADGTTGNNTSGANDDGTDDDAAATSSTSSMDEDSVQKIYLYHAFVNGGASWWTMSIYHMMSFLTSDTAQSYVSSFMDSSNTAQLSTMLSLMDEGLNGTAYDPAGMYERLNTLGNSGGFDMSSGSLDSPGIELLYLYRDAQDLGSSTQTEKLEDFIDFICERVLNSSLFSSYIDAETRADITDAQQTIRDNKDKLITGTTGRTIVEASFSAESAEMKDFIANLKTTMSDTLSGDYYLVGEGPMAVDMTEGFMDELNFITLITAAAIFLIVLLTFRNLAIPIILVAMIQGSFFWVMALNGLAGSPMYYVAIIIVQAILMGATIDYAILYASNYRENRQTRGIQDAIAASYKASIPTFLTSGTILVAVTLILGVAMGGSAVAKICLTIAEGATLALILVMFILPGVLAACDRVVAGKHRAPADGSSTQVNAQALDGAQDTLAFGEPASTFALDAFEPTPIALEPAPVALEPAPIDPAYFTAHNETAGTHTQPSTESTPNLLP